MRLKLDVKRRGSSWSYCTIVEKGASNVSLKSTGVDLLRRLFELFEKRAKYVLLRGTIFGTPKIFWRVFSFFTDQTFHSLIQKKNHLLLCYHRKWYPDYTTISENNNLSETYTLLYLDQIFKSKNVIFSQEFKRKREI